MLEYITELLRTQRKIAAQFEKEEQPGIPNYDVRGENPRNGSEKSDAREEKRKEPSSSEDGPGGGGGSVEQKLWEMRRAVMRMQAMQMQKAAGAAQERARSMERRTQKVFERQGVALSEKKAEAMDGGLTASYEKTLRTGGIASTPGQMSMQEISRFFERDARRYG